MLWRVPSLCGITDSSFPLGLQQRTRTIQCFSYNIRGITTTRSFLAVQTGDDTGTEGRWQMKKTALGNTDLEASTHHLRCVQLLDANRVRKGIYIRSKFIDKTVSLSGTIKTIRKQKHGAFAHVTDGSCLRPVQVVLDPELAAPLSNGTSLQVKGTWKASPARGQSCELIAEVVEVFGTTDAEKYPIQKKYQTPEFLRTIPHLRLRTSFNSTLARFRSSCLSFVNTYLSETDQKGGMFVQVQPPIITSSDCEGAGEVFAVVSNAAASRSTQPQQQSVIADPVPFFRTPKYLTVSSQLHLEAYAAELRNVWTLSPTFRAEKSDTPRHLAEFYMLEIEISYVSTLRALMGVTEHLIRSLVTNMYQPFHEEFLQSIRASKDDTVHEKVKELEHRWQAILGDRWITATYAYCMKQLVEAASADPKLFERRPEYGSGLQLEHERWVVEKIGGGRPIFVTHYPRAIKPFYMAPSLLAKDHPSHPTYRPARFADERFDDTETGEDTVACFDLLMPFGACEIAGGSLREHRLQGLIRSMREDGMLKLRETAQQSSSSNQTNDVVSDVTKDNNDGDPYPFLQPGESLGSLKWYADLRRYGTMPHGGMGIGWDRLIAYLTGAHNLRDVVPFPRSFGKADC